MRRLSSILACVALTLVAGCSTDEPPYVPTDADKLDYAVASMSSFTRLTVGRPLSPSEEAQLRGMGVDHPEVANLVDGGLESCDQLRTESVRSIAQDAEDMRDSIDFARGIRDLSGTEWDELDYLTDPLDALDMASEHLCPDLRDKFFQVEERIG